MIALGCIGYTAPRPPLTAASFGIYINTDILMPVKPIEFLGDSLRSPREFPDDAKRDIDLTKQRFALLSRK